MLFFLFTSFQDFFSKYKNIKPVIPTIIMAIPKSGCRTNIPNPSKHIINGYPADQMLPETKRDCKQTAKTNIGQQPDSMTWLYILISFLKDHI